MAFLERLQQARDEAATEGADPWRKKVEAVVRDMDAVSTAALLDLVRSKATTGTARRLAAIMRSLNFIPVKSRRFMPGGHCGNTCTRGWARPVRGLKSSAPRTSHTGTAGHLKPEGIFP